MLFITRLAVSQAIRNLKIEPLWESATTTALVEAALQVEDFSLDRTIHIVRQRDWDLPGAARRLMELIQSFDHSLSREGV